MFDALFTAGIESSTAFNDFRNPYDPYWYSGGLGSESDAERLEKLKKLGLVLTLCDGNVLRSRVGAMVLRSRLIPAISAAVGDISQQENKIYVPDSVLRCIRRVRQTNADMGWASGKLKQVDPLMAACAKDILVYCDPAHLPLFIGPQDPRVHLLYTPDPNTEEEYYQTCEQVTQLTHDFINTHHPEYLAVNICPNPFTAKTLRERIHDRIENLDFSCVPREWGSPLQCFPNGWYEEF